MTTPITIRRLNAANQHFSGDLDDLLSSETVSDAAVNQRVLEIIQAVRARGEDLGQMSVDAFVQHLTAALAQN